MQNRAANLRRQTARDFVCQEAEEEKEIMDIKDMK